MAAKHYLWIGDPDLAAWLGKNLSSVRALGGYRALRFLLQEESAYIVVLDTQAWERWAPIVLGFPFFSGSDANGEEARGKLLKLAYRNAPAAIIDTLNVLITQENAEDHGLSILRTVEPLWDEGLQSALETRLEDSALGARGLGTLLNVLLDHGSQTARRSAEAIVTTTPNSASDPEGYRFHAALALLLHAPDSGWVTVWPTIERDSALGRRLIETLAYWEDRHSGTVASHLTEEQLATLYRWTSEQFPPAEDPGPNKEAHFTSLTPRANVAFWRDGLISVLKTRGTENACAALAQLVNELPDREWLKWVLDEARAIARQGSWQPLESDDLLRLAAEGRRELEEHKADMGKDFVSVRRAVIMTALQIEYRAVQAHLVDLRENIHPQGTVYEVGNFIDSDRRWEVLIAEIGAGNDSAAAEAERAIKHFQPEVAMFIGVAGGVKDVELGDVIAADKVYDYESGKDYGSGFAPRPDVGKSSYSLGQRARVEARKGNWQSRIIGGATEKTPRAHIGPIAAGEKVVGSKRAATAKLIRAQYGDTLAVEMEGSGFLKATQANEQVVALVIRGISDLLSKKAEADKAGWQGQAARNASAFAFEILARYIRA